MDMKDAEEDDWEAAEQESPEALSDTGWDDEVVEEVANGDWPALESTATELSDACAVRDRQPSYEILTEQELMQRQNILVERVVEQLFVSPEEATTLLRAYGWNILNLINDWLDEPDKVKTKVGLARVILPTEVSDRDAPFVCSLCMDKFAMDDTLGLSCGHRYCIECWTKWVVAEFDKGPQAVFTTCPGFKCSAMIPEEIQLRLLPGPKRQQFKQWLLDAFVQGNRTKMKWCPNPDCDKVIENRTGGEVEIECRCGYVFCFKCGLEGHRPCSCELVQQWLKKNSTDSENVNWIIANTKRCPKCHVNIEKNQGCNHMTCRFCKYDFCWLCKGDWSKHGSGTGGFYRCNKYEEAKAKGENASLEKEEQKAQEARNALQKYMFYFTRFDNHQKSIQFARKTRQDAEARMQLLRDIQGTNYQDVQFVLNAVNAVVACRRVLMWTYAYGFYLQGTSEKDIFEQHQERLEKFTELLHGLSEKPIEELLENKTRAEIVNYTRVVLRYRDNVIKAIETGLKSAQDIR
ncbi:hypothetical protein PBRA_003308 [Plasmodiophora brassicae]|uniref:RBR-type E3 ubiquitin transferase n=1 Tax=Plasmodiophora brassicae TaxID=37360 RepID=A0A0G4J8V8_PLABS|nr:hypothetical protein PBRA_003308 [Plasmodiophora brassicae]